jgi:transcriptional regulator with XRE-family HTH domain
VQKGPFTPKRRAVQRLLREIRLEAGLRQKDLADHLNVDQTYVSRCERGERQLDLAELDDLCEAVGIPLEEFVRRYREAIESDPTQ